MFDLPASPSPHGKMHLLRAERIRYELEEWLCAGGLMGLDDFIDRQAEKVHWREGKVREARTRKKVVRDMKEKMRERKVVLRS